MRNIPGLSTKEQQSIIDQIIKMLKVQTDRRRDVTTRGSKVINPQNLSTNSASPTILGPFMFGTTFAQAPYITFGQARMQQQQVVQPFVCQVYVDSWVASSGGIIGVSIGILPLVSIPSGLQQHAIYWMAVGKASLYKSNNSNESWNSSYNVNQASNLTMTDGSLEKAI